MATQIGDAAKDLTASEIAYIKAVFRHSTAKMNADWEKVADEVKVKNGKVARDRFHQISVKHAFGPSQESSSPQKSPAKVTKKRTPRKKKVGKEKGEKEEEEGVEDAVSKWTAVNSPTSADVASPAVKDEDVFGA